MSFFLGIAPPSRADHFPLRTDLGICHCAACSNGWVGGGDAADNARFRHPLLCVLICGSGVELTNVRFLAMDARLAAQQQTREQRVLARKDKARPLVDP